MRLTKVNEHEVRCVITGQDLEAHKITMKELRYGSKETQELFKEVVSKAVSEYDFNEEGLPLMIEAVPMKNNELLVILTAVEDAEELDPHFAEFAENAPEDADARPESRFLETDAENEAHKAFVMRFPGIDETVRFCKQVPLFSGRSMLYRSPDGGFYMTLTRPEQMSGKDFIMFINASSEFGEVVPESAVLYAQLREHGTPVMEDPLVKLVKVL